MSKISKVLLKARISECDKILQSENLLKYDMSESKETAKSVSSFLADCIIKNQIDINSIWDNYLKSKYDLIVDLLNEFQCLSNRFNHNKYLSSQAKSKSQDKTANDEQEINDQKLLTEKENDFVRQTRKKIIKLLKALANEYHGVNEKEYEKIVHILADLGEPIVRAKKIKAQVQKNSFTLKK